MFVRFHKFTSFFFYVVVLIKCVKFHELFVVHQYLLKKLFVNVQYMNVLWVNTVQDLKFLMNHLLRLSCWLHKVHYLFQRTILFRKFLPKLRIILCKFYRLILEHHQMLTKQAINFSIWRIMICLFDLIQKSMY